MSVIGWFKRAISGTDPDDGELGGPDNFGGEGDDEKISVFGGTKQFYTEDSDCPYAENYASASSRENGNEVSTTRPQSREMQSGSITPVTGRSNLNVSLITPKRFEDGEIHKAIQMFRDEGCTIILSLGNCEEEQSFVSFAIGLAGGVNGRIDDVSQSIYILVPKSAGLSGDFEDIENQVVQMPRSKFV